MSRARLAVGVDFGGTNIKCGLVTLSGRVVRSHTFASAACAKPAAFIECVARSVEQLAAAEGIRRSALAGIGVGAPGPVDGQRGLVQLLVNVPGWRKVPLASRLTRRLHLRAVIDNDVNLVTLGEWSFGAGRGARNLVCLTLGTGVGGGLMIEGRLFRGSSGTAGELGHMVIDPRGPRCGCGARGCLEAHVGTAAIVRLGRAIPRQGIGPLTPEQITRAAERGNRRAQAVWARIGAQLGIGLANVVNLLNPDRIVIGGGVANAWRWFYPTMTHTMRAQALAVPASEVRVVRARLGNRAGIVGAAVLVWNELGER